MARLLLITALQLVLAAVAVSLVRTGRTPLTRFGAVAAVLCLLPLMLLGAMWPSLHTILAVVALPSLVIWLACVVSPRVLRQAQVRWYGFACLMLAVAASALQIGWLGSCPEVTIVVPDGFAGEVRFIKDSSAGIDLAERGYRAVVSATGELRIRDASFMHRCYTTVVLSASGVAMRFQDKGVQAASQDMPWGRRWSGELDGTTYRWVVE